MTEKENFQSIVTYDLATYKELMKETHNKTEWRYLLLRCMGYVELPAVQSRGKNILECPDDVLVVSFETYLLSSDLAENIHSDDIGRITIERRNG